MGQAYFFKKSLFRILNSVTGTVPVKKEFIFALRINQEISVSSMLPDRYPFRSNVTYRNPRV